MSFTEAAVDDERNNTIFTVVAPRKRRLVLEALRRHPDPVPESDIATRVVARNERTEPSDVTDAERRRARVSLVHEHLPALSDAGLIERTADGVTTADHPIYDGTSRRRVLDPDVPEAVLRALGDDRRRLALEILRRETSVDSRRLAARIAARELGVSVDEAPAERIEDVLTALRHVHLPILVDAGLVEHGSGRTAVIYAGRPELEPAWFDAEFDDLGRAVANTA